MRHAPHIGLGLPPGLAAGARPPFDVVWCNAVPALRAAHDGLCDPLSPASVPELGSLHDRARPAGLDGWPVVMAYVVHYVLVFRRAAFPAGPPDSWRVLLDPRHRGKVALYPAGNGIHPVAQLLGGGSVDDIPAAMEPCWRTLREVAPQVRTLDYSIGMEDALRRGELDLCFRALPNALGFQAAGLDVGWSAPVEGVPDTADALWVPRGLPPATAAWAKRYVDFALSRPQQRSWSEALGVLPIRTDAPTPALLVDCPRLPSAIDDPTGVLHVPDAVKLEHEREWGERFATVVS